MDKKEIKIEQEKNIDGLIADLRGALEADNNEKVIEIMNKIGNRVEAAVGSAIPAQTVWDKDFKVFQTHLGAGGGGRRIRLRKDEHNDQEAWYLVFAPDVIDQESGKLYTNGFKNVFGDSAGNTQEGDIGHFVIKILSLENN